MNITLPTRLFITVVTLSPAYWFAGAQQIEAQQQNSRKFVLKEIGDADSTYALAFSPNGKYLLSGGNEADENDDRYNRIVTRWLIATGKADAKWKNENKGQVAHIAFSNSGKYLAVGDTSGEIHVLSEAGKPVNSFRHFKNGNTGILHLSVMDDTTLFSVCLNATGHDWNILTNRSNTYSFYSAYGVLYGAAATASAKTVVSVERDSMNFSGDRLQNDLGHITLPQKHGIKSCVLNEVGTLVLATADSGRLYLFDVKTKKLLKKWEGHPQCGEIYGVLPLPGRNAFVTSDGAGFIKFWNNQGELLADVRCHETAIGAFAVSPDSAILATAGETQPIVLWDLESILKKKR